MGDGSDDLFGDDWRWRWTAMARKTMAMRCDPQIENWVGDAMRWERNLGDGRCSGKILNIPRAMPWHALARHGMPMHAMACIGMPWHAMADTDAPTPVSKIYKNCNEWGSRGSPRAHTQGKRSHGPRPPASFLNSSRALPVPFSGQIRPQT